MLPRAPGTGEAALPRHQKFSSRPSDSHSMHSLVSASHSSTRVSEATRTTSSPRLYVKWNALVCSRKVDRSSVLTNPCSGGEPATQANGQFIQCSGSQLHVCPAGYWCHVGIDPSESVCCPGGEFAAIRDALLQPKIPVFCHQQTGWEGLHWAAGISIRIYASARGLNFCLRTNSLQLHIFRSGWQPEQLPHPPGMPAPMPRIPVSVNFPKKFQGIHAPLESQPRRRQGASSFVPRNSRLVLRPIGVTSEPAQTAL